MKQKQFTRKGANVDALRGIRRALRHAAMERERERKKALLSGMLKDFYLESLQFLEEYVLYLPQTFEQVQEAKARFRLFADRRCREYADEACPLVSELYPNNPKAWFSFAPFAVAMREARAARNADELRANSEKRH